MLPLLCLSLSRRVIRSDGGAVICRALDLAEFVGIASASFVVVAVVVWLDTVEDRRLNRKTAGRVATATASVAVASAATASFGVYDRAVHYYYLFGLLCIVAIQWKWRH
jgi:hypothetical protein